MPKSPLILIVDDDRDFLEIFGTKLGSAGFAVEVAQDGEEGIKKARELKPDLVLMDMKMPGMSGAEAILKLKSDPATKDIKCAFLSSLGEVGREADVLNSRFSVESGAAGYLKKTDDLDYLVDRVRLFLK